MTRLQELLYQICHNEDMDERVICQNQIDNLILKDPNIVKNVEYIYTVPYNWVDVLTIQQILSNFSLVLPYGIWDIVKKNGTAAELYAVLAIRKG